MIEFDIVNNDDENPTEFSREDIADFLFEYLDKYRDERSHILDSISYAYGDEDWQDGFILVGYEDGTIVGTVIINHTNMSGFIPEHLLVYIAVHADYRGRGIGKQLIEHIIEETEGDIALHVEPNNPAKHLYEKFGFTNKYLEMRLKK